MHRPRSILPPLRSRALRLAILAFQALWLNIIVPGHTRGAVQLPGSDCAACGVTPDTPQGRSCCHAKQGAAPNTKPVPAPAPVDPASHCAICHFAALLSPAIAVDCTHPPLSFVAVTPTQPAYDAGGRDSLPTYLGRAPPFSC
ncbi:MAG: hypothetical protein JWN51_31 [Phycisphaerales bacterium]|nr:hypothetical protein [Phycisphaerales bacterium]